MAFIKLLYSPDLGLLTWKLGKTIIGIPQGGWKSEESENKVSFSRNWGLMIRYFTEWNSILPWTNLTLSRRVVSYRLDFQEPTHLYSLGEVGQCRLSGYFHVTAGMRISGNGKDYVCDHCTVVPTSPVLPCLSRGPAVTSFLGCRSLGWGLLWLQDRGKEKLGFRSAAFVLWAPEDLQL